MLVFGDLWVLLGKGNHKNLIVSGFQESHRVSVLSGLVSLHLKVTFLSVAL